MSKFPLLNLYRSVAIVLAVVVVLIGLGTAWNAATLFGRNLELGIFVVTALPFLGGAFALGVVAELILLFLKIEDHLDKMSIGGTQFSRSREVFDASVNISAPTQGIVKVEKTAIYATPGLRRSTGTVLRKGDAVKVYGRNIDSRWVQIDTYPEGWVLAEVLNIEGDIRQLPVTSDRQ